MSERITITYPSERLLIEATAARILLELGDRLARQPRVDLALTGGRDANDIYASMSDSPLSETVDWARVHLWWSDERFVPFGDVDRNAGQARRAWYGRLIEQGLLPKSNVHEMPVDRRAPEQVAGASDEDNEEALRAGASEYERELAYDLGDEPHFDLAVFGVGPDGHFASLFPDHGEAEITDETVNVVGVNHSPKPPSMRLSLTVPCIRRSRKVWFFASTAEKAQGVKSALSGRNDPHVPSSYGEGRQETLWLLDHDAAAELNSPSHEIA
ncbi:6-phosphogluconolactonase [Bifidobacterium actinocoloniiforme DSM 22766]|uniref:6-phosphogluconolactonase n=1 Tax=Bifidobacterium actinocoloniiforme DSM 22766 TaxID=1437605 RepID=A0A086YYF5_9BIFI|nr:6-phosphogluconolactonase [Bifidobacterium actinocoloniiforme]AKV55855.1 6-phosphogluconolactonase [Bifidobacterium actinocoloniiforme DSM 22766]KFI39305.1 6-phosphogluconolactonase [Bifidobacterium actinocoloniiforme DSM 22766]